MNTNVHIERLVLDGLPVESGEGDLVQAAVETELTRLLVEHGFSFSSAADVPRLSAEPIHLTHGSKPSSLGHQIAQAIYGSFKPVTTSRRETRFPGGRKR